MKETNAMWIPMIFYLQPSHPVKEGGIAGEQEALLFVNLEWLGFSETLVLA